MLQNLGSAPAPAPADGLIKETTTQAFVKDVIEESKRQPVLIDFWAPWCGPCKQLTPILEKVVRAAKGKVKLVKMNIDEHPAIPGQMGIQSIPAVIAFVNGQPADGFMGALPEGQVTAFIERLTKDKIAGGAQDLVAQAEAAADAAALALWWAGCFPEWVERGGEGRGMVRAYVTFAGRMLALAADLLESSAPEEAALCLRAFSVWRAFSASSSDGSRVMRRSPGGVRAINRWR